MNSPRYKGLICFDFDGTLHSAGSSPFVSLGARRMIERLARSGYAWGINTGRDFDFLLEGIKESDFLTEPDFLVAREREIFWVDSVTGEWRIDESWAVDCDRLHAEVFEREALAIRQVEKFVREQTAAEWVSIPGDLAGLIATDLAEMEVILNETESVVYDGIHIEKWGVFENYFKAGNYLQTLDEGASAKVKYYELEVTH